MWLTRPTGWASSPTGTSWGRPPPSTALGSAKEWLAHIPAERTRFQPNTITDLDAIVEELRRTRRRGYAIDNSERDPNVRCVGVPVYNSAGKLVAGVSTSGPAITMTDEKLMECAGILQNAALRMRERIYR